MESMRLFAVYAAAILCVCGLSALAAERFGQWSLEQPNDFVFALSFKRATLFDDRTAASQLAFVCNQEKKDVATYLQDREAEGVKSVHFYFPNDLEEGMQATNHIIIEVPGFSGGVAAF